MGQVSDVRDLIIDFHAEKWYFIQEPILLELATKDIGVKLGVPAAWAVVLDDLEDASIEARVIDNGILEGVCVNPADSRLLNPLLGLIKLLEWHVLQVILDHLIQSLIVIIESDLSDFNWVEIS